MYKTPFIFNLLLLSLSSLAEDLPRRVLITGFGPFSDIPTNPSGEIVRNELAAALNRQCNRPGIEYELRAPIEVNEAGLRRQLEGGRNFWMAIAVGVTHNVPGRENVTGRVYPGGFVIETTAQNCTGNKRGRTCIVAGGPVTHEIFPLPASVARPIASTGTGSIPVSFGDAYSCGDGLCNATLYSGLHQNRDQHFIHIPREALNAQRDYANALAILICRIINARLESPAVPRPPVVTAPATPITIPPPIAPTHGS